MQVLKFGGSSVANATNINKVIAIVKRALANDRTVVVSSAISGATDALLLIGKTAKNGDESYLQLIDSLQEKHNAIIAELIPAEESETIKETCNSLFNKLKGSRQSLQYGPGSTLLALLIGTRLCRSLSIC